MGAQPQAPASPSSSPVVAGCRRFDFLDVISHLYVESFWGELARWCEARNVPLSGHGWEESLWNEAAFTGSLFRVQHALPLPGVDSLLDRGRSPREIKESASVAHFESKGLSVENQGVLGIDSYLDPERMKIAINDLFETSDAPGIVVREVEMDAVVDRVVAILDQRVGRDFQVDGPLKSHIR